jgi:signal transduction histidine kinase
MIPSLMPLIFFLYGLAFFAMGMSVALESRWASALAFGHHLRWLAAFGFVHSLVEWSDMFMLINGSGPVYDGFLLARSVLLPLSALLLVRFGIGLVGEAGPLPRFMTFVPAVLLVPVALLAAYVLIVLITEPGAERTSDIWSRYLLYLPGSLFAAFGFLRQARRLPASGFRRAQDMFIGAALAFLLNAIVAGLIVPEGPHEIFSWLNQEKVQAVTGLPVQVWRMASALGIAFFVVRALGVFKVEREQQIAELNRARVEAQQDNLRWQTEARCTAEKWTDGLVSVSRQIANLEDADAVLATITDQARQLLASDTAALALWDDKFDQLELKCLATANGVSAATASTVHNRMILDAVRAGRALRFPEEQRGEWVCPVTQRVVEAAAVVPLQVDGRPIGGLWVARYVHRAYGPEDVTGLGRLADQAVIALEHALMAARLQSLAVVEERARLAREMHDGLSQILGYLSLETQTLEAMVRQGDREGTLAELKEARSRIKAAQADVRENILSLRTTLAGNAGLLPALQQYVVEFGVQTGIEAQVKNDLAEPPRLSPLAETQLVRIVQEALANVRKHAQAKHVTVRLHEQDAGLAVGVLDDGVGFRSVPDHNHYGLSTMRERAEDVGGTLQVISRPDDGTHVQLWLPMLETEVMRVAA